MNIRERIIDLTEEQVDIIESKLDEYDKNYIHYKLDGRIQIGIEEDGKLVAGLDDISYRTMMGYPRQRQRRNKQLGICEGGLNGSFSNQTW